MKIVKRVRFEEAAKQYPKYASVIWDTFEKMRKGRFETPEAMKKVFISLDNFKYKDKWYVADLGKSIRLIAFINFRSQTVFIKGIMKHADYDKFCDKYRRAGK